MCEALRNPVQAGRRHDGERVVPLSVLLRPHNRVIGGKLSAISNIEGQ